MATKNLVPRANNEGELGISSRKWKGINAVSGSFESLITDTLLNSDGDQLVIAGDNITIEQVDNSSGSKSLKIISSASGGSAEVDNIFQGTNGSTVKVQTVSSANEKKIKFITNNQERWIIDEDGHFVPTADSVRNIGSLDNVVNYLYIDDTDGFRLVSPATTQDQVSINLSDKKRLQVSSNFVNNNFVYDKVIVYKEPVKVVQDSDLSGFGYSTGTFTESTQSGSLTIDDENIANGDRILIKSQTSLDQNGIYVASGIGTGLTVSLTRSNDLSSGSDFSGAIVHVLKGTSNAGKVFYASTDLNGNSVTGTNDLIWSSFSSSGIKDIVEDTTPQLGGNLDLNDKFITNSNTIKIFSQGLDSTSNANEGLEINKNEVKISYTATGSPALAQPTLTLGVDSSKILKIESPATTFFTTPSISGNDFTFKFSSANMSTDEVNTRSAFFATQGWVTGQIDNITPVDTSTFVVKDSNASLESLTLSGGITNNDTYGLTLNTKKIGGLALPTELSDAASKQYVDNYAQGISTLKEVRVATTSPFSGNVVYQPNQEGGRIRNMSVGSINDAGIDGITNLAIDDRVLVKNESDKEANGIYKIADLGSAGTTWKIIRTTDFAANFQSNGSFVFVEEGTSNNATGFICISPTANDTVGTDDIEFVLFSKAGSITAGSGLTGSSQFEVKVKPSAINGSPNADRLIFIDSDNTVHADIENIITKINESSSTITGATASSFTFPTTELTPIINTTKILANDSDNKYVNGLKLKQFILSFDSSDIEFTYTAASGNDPEKYVATLKDESVGASELKTSAITGQAHKQKLINSVNTEVGPVDDDLFLISDSENSSALKRVKFSKIKENLSADINIASKDDIDKVSSDDFILIHDSTDASGNDIGSNNNKRISALDLASLEKTHFFEVTDSVNFYQSNKNEHVIISDTDNNSGTGTGSIPEIALPNTADLAPGSFIKVSVFDIQDTNVRVNIQNEGNDPTLASVHIKEYNASNAEAGATLFTFSSLSFHHTHTFVWSGTKWMSASRQSHGIDGNVSMFKKHSGSIDLSAWSANDHWTSNHMIHNITNSTTTIKLPNIQTIAPFVQPILYMNVMLPFNPDNNDKITVTVEGANANNYILLNNTVSTSSNTISGSSSKIFDVRAGSIVRIRFMHKALLSTVMNNTYTIDNTSVKAIVMYDQYIPPPPEAPTLPSGTNGQVLLFNSSDELSSSKLSNTNFNSGAVDTAALGSNSVTTTKITDKNVTKAKMADLNSKNVALGKLSQVAGTDKTVAEIPILFEEDSLLLLDVREKDDDGNDRAELINNKLVSATQVKKYILKKLEEFQPIGETTSSQSFASNAYTTINFTHNDPLDTIYTIQNSAFTQAAGLEAHIAVKSDFPVQLSYNMTKDNSTGQPYYKPDLGTDIRMQRTFPDNSNNFQIRDGMILSPKYLFNNIELPKFNESIGKTIYFYLISNIDLTALENAITNAGFYLPENNPNDVLPNFLHIPAFPKLVPNRNEDLLIASMDYNRAYFTGKNYGIYYDEVGTVYPYEAGKLEGNYRNDKIIYRSDIIQNASQELIPGFNFLFTAPLSNTSFANRYNYYGSRGATSNTAGADGGGNWGWSSTVNGLLYKNANTPMVGGTTAQNAGGVSPKNWGQLSSSKADRRATLSVCGFSNQGDDDRELTSHAQGYLKWPGLSIGRDDYQKQCVLLKLKPNETTRTWEAQIVAGDDYYKIIEIPTGITG